MVGTKKTDKGHAFRPKKSLGQHFLKDHEMIREMVSRAGFKKGDRILEIGPGLGALTFPLADAVQEVVAVEKDPLLSRRLRQKLDRENIQNVHLITGDILRIDLRDGDLFKGKKMCVVGSLPYNISSPILEKLVQNRRSVHRAVLMFQSEFARRVSASPGGRDYGAMSILIQYFAHVAALLDVPKEAFVPRPRVDSMVVELDFERPYPRRARDEESFRRTVRGAFSQRRKTLLNSLGGSFSYLTRGEILDVLQRCGIDPGKRAESLNIDDFLCLSSAILRCRLLDNLDLY